MDEGDRPAVDPKNLRSSIIQSAIADVEARLRNVRCPVDGRHLTAVRMPTVAGQAIHVDGCCGAVAEAWRALQD
jgi:hypothetical protein